MTRLLSGLLCAFAVSLPAPVLSAEPALRRQVSKALHEATEYFRTQVSVEGGYLWQYTEDLARREGEGKATATTAWVQPPGTPSVGMALLEAYRATGDHYYLEAAVETSRALLKGQLLSGGWDYRIEMDPDKRRQYAYRVEPADPSGRNRTTLDDNTTQSALQFLMRVDRALDFEDEAIHEAVQYALSSLLAAQYPNGAWPQRYTHSPDPDTFPVRRAEYPPTWSRTFPDENYRGHYTFNDNAIADLIDTMFEASAIYEATVINTEQKYRTAAEKAGSFILLAQMPEPQPAWTQQYNTQMQPSWARRFEPPAVTGGESQGVMRTLLVLFRETGDRKYLEPLPRAIAYLRRSQLPGGRLARFYELKTNRPLFFTKQYELTYSDADLPTHYSFKVSNGLDRIAREWELLRAAGPKQLKRLTKARPPAPSGELATRAKALIADLDDRGRWVESGRLRYHGADDPARRIIRTRTFIRNVTTLSAYLASTRSPTREKDRDDAR